MRRVPLALVMTSVLVTISTGVPLAVLHASEPAPITSVTIGAAHHEVDGTNVYRGSDLLVVYTPDNRPTSEANAYGFEASVVDGKVVDVQNGVGNMDIPTNGYVLSGHGEAGTWLQTNAVVGAQVLP